MPHYDLIDDNSSSFLTNSDTSSDENNYECPFKTNQILSTVVSTKLVTELSVSAYKESKVWQSPLKAGKIC